MLDKRQGLAAKDLLDQRRLDVHHPVVEPRLGAGLAVVQFIGVQHHGGARQAVKPIATVLETLHALEGAADGVGVMAVRRETVAGEKRFDTLHAAARRRAVNPVVVAGWLGHGGFSLLDARHGNLRVGGCRVADAWWSLSGSAAMG